MNKLLTAIILVFFLTSLVAPISAEQFSSVENNFSSVEDNENLTEENEVIINYFYQSGCPYCSKQEVFFEELEEKYPEITIYKHDIAKRSSIEKLDVLIEAYELELDRVGVPMTFIEGEFFMGYHSSIGEEIENIVENKLGEPVENEEINEGTKEDLEKEEDKTHLPIIGEIDLSRFSLPAITFTLGSLDGMNVCSIGALILILAIVVKFDSRKKILLYGGLFILTTAIVYGLLVFAWYGIIKSLFAYISFLSLLIGLAGIIGGIYFFKMFLTFYKYGPTCKVKKNKYITAIQKKVNSVLEDPEKGFFAVASVLIIFAIAVTIIELPCSFALPLIFSGILADAALPAISSIFYIITYLFFYMLIEIIIFLGAVYTKELWYGPGKSVTWVTLLASLILFGLGFYYISHLLPV